MSSSTPSPGCGISLLADEELEPYVRKKRGSSETRNKMIGLNEEEQNILRTSINSRERKRMHDLNEAHEELRSCIPYGQEANSRKLSKISTIMLASNWIRHLSQENARLQSEVTSLRRQLSSPSDPPSVVPSIPQIPSGNLPMAFNFQCTKQFGNNCFCVACLTMAIGEKKSK